MAIFFITLFAIALAVLPLQWQVPFNIFSSQSSVPWNGPAIVLYSVSGLFYLVVFIQKKKWLSPSAIRDCLLMAAILTSWWLLLDRSHSSAIEVLRLLGVVWFFPVIWFVVSQLGPARLFYLLVAIAVIHAQWGIAQFIKQGDLGLYILGETRLDVAAPGIAKFAVSDNDGIANYKILRAYGPYPHPNSFGGALLIGYVAGLVLLLRKNGSAVTLPVSFIFMALMLTFSRNALLAMAIASIVALCLPQTAQVKPRDIWRILVFIIVTSLVFTPFWLLRLSDPDDVAAAERLLGTTAAWRLIQDNPWRGVGIGQYPVALQHYLDSRYMTYQPWQIAPVHSVPLLVLAQVGVVGATFVVFAVGYYLRRLPWRQLIWLTPLLPLLLFDHYLLTQVAPLVLLVVWLTVTLQLHHECSPHSLAVKRSKHS